MPPKNKVTKEDLISAALQIVRENGERALNARTLADRVGCSTQPVFSNFSTMEDLRVAVGVRAEELCEEYIAKETEKGEFPPYKAGGMAYIQFAAKEPELFKLLYMRDRSTDQSPEWLQSDYGMVRLVESGTGLSGDTAKLFHLEMWVFVHGVATMFATGFLNLDRELISRMLTDCYLGLRKQYGME